MLWPKTRQFDYSGGPYLTYNNPYYRTGKGGYVTTGYVYTGSAYGKYPVPPGSLLPNCVGLPRGRYQEVIDRHDNKAYIADRTPTGWLSSAPFPAEYTKSFENNYFEDTSGR